MNSTFLKICADQKWYSDVVPLSCTPKSASHSVNLCFASRAPITIGITIEITFVVIFDILLMLNFKS